MGDIAIAKFVLPDPKRFDGQELLCINMANGLVSPNNASIKFISDGNYQIGEWSEWSKDCYDVMNETKVFRKRMMNNTGNNGVEVEVQSRYCRCSDLHELPSPR